MVDGVCDLYFHTVVNFGQLYAWTFLCTKSGTVVMKVQATKKVEILLDQKINACFTSRIFIALSYLMVNLKCYKHYLIAYLYFSSACIKHRWYKDMRSGKLRFKKL